MSTAPDPKLAVIIPHYNDLVRLRACLAVLTPQIDRAGEVVEAVVVDNASPLDLGPLEADFPKLRLVIEPAKGAAAARNRGVLETTAPYLAFLDCDCVPAPDWLDSALRLARNGVVIGGRVDTFDETPPPRSGAEAFEAVFAFHQKRYIEEAGFSVTANLVTSREVFDRTGPLIVGLAEDVDWCRRAITRGYALVYADDLRVSHPTRRDWPALVKKWRRTTNERFMLNGTGAGGRAKWFVMAGVVLVSGPAHLPKVLGASALDGREKLRGAWVLLRLRALRSFWMLRQVAIGR